VPLVLWILMLVARSFVALRRNGRVYPASIGRNALRLLMLVPLSAMLDGATFIGTINWLFKDLLRRDAVAGSGAGEAK